MSVSPVITVLAHNIRSLWNVGSLFRTCDAMGVSTLYLTGYTGRPPRREITKTALGAEETIAWEHHDEPMRVLESLKADGFFIVSLEQTSCSISLATFQPVFPLCLILGHELEGVRQDILLMSDAVVDIPMHGMKESLNVAVAAGIALFEIRTAALRADEYIEKTGCACNNGCYT